MKRLDRGRRRHSDRKVSAPEIFHPKLSASLGGKASKDEKKAPPPLEECKDRERLEYALEGVDRKAVVQLLKKSSSRPLTKCPGGWDAMFWAVGQDRGDTREREQLVSLVGRKMAELRTKKGWNPPCAVNVQDTLGLTPMHWACALNKPGVIRKLNGLGAKLDIFTHDGFSPLHMAVSEQRENSQVDNTAAIKMILSIKPDAVNLVSPNGEFEGWTPGHMAMAEGRVSYMELLTQTMKLKTVLSILDGNSNKSTKAHNFKEVLNDQCSSDKSQVVKQKKCVDLLLARKRILQNPASHKRAAAEEGEDGGRGERAGKRQRRTVEKEKPAEWPASVDYVLHMRLGHGVEEMKNPVMEYETPIQVYYCEDKKKKRTIEDEWFVHQVRDAINLGPIEEIEVRQIRDISNPTVHAQGELFPAKMAEQGGAYGVFVKKGGYVQNGTILGEYVGELKKEHKIHEEISNFGENSTVNLMYNFPLQYSQKFTKDPDQHLIIDASSVRGEIPCVNDHWGFSYQPQRVQNSEFIEVLVDGWPHILLQATCDIRDGEEVLTSYGRDYWDQMEKSLGLLKEHKDRLAAALAEQEQAHREAFPDKLQEWLELQHKAGKLTEKERAKLAKLAKDTGAFPPSPDSA